MDWDDLRVFLTAASYPSLSAAAKAARLSVQTVGRRIETLERVTGLRLIRRTPRGLVLTEAGRKLADRASGLGAQAADVIRFVATLREGNAAAFVRLSTTEPIVTAILAPRLPDLLHSANAPRLELRTEAEIAAIALDEADIAVRLIRPTTDSLTARRLTRLKFGLYGTIADAENDPASARLLGYDDSYGQIPERRWLAEAGLEDRVVVRLSSTRGLVAAVAAGAGLAVLPDLLARQAGLVRIDRPGLPPFPTRDVWLIWHSDSRSDRHIKTVVAWVGRAFAHAARE